jgi:O-antigen ligase
MIIKTSQKNKINLLFIAFLIFALIPLSSQRMEVIISIIFVLLLLLHSYSIRKNNRKKIKKTFILNSLLFFVLMLTLLDGIDVRTFKKIEQMFSLCIVPLIFYLISKEELSKLKNAFELWKKVFVISTFILAIVCLSIFLNYSNPKYPNLDSNFFRNAIQDSSYFSRHPIYISIFLNVASIIVVESFFRHKTIGKRILQVFFFIVFMTLLFLLSTKMAIISLLFCLIILLYFNLKKKLFFMVTALVFASFFLYLLSSPNKLNRFSKLFEKNILFKNERYNSIYVHKETILCSLKILKENFAFGVGIENTNKLVDSCLREKYKYNPSVLYNSHNQYLSFGLHSGFLALVLLLIIIANALKKSYQLQNKFLFILVIYFSIIFLTENVLERQTGIILFAFILNLIPLLQPNNYFFEKKI